MILYVVGYCCWCWALSRSLVIVVACLVIGVIVLSYISFSLYNELNTRVAPLEKENKDLKRQVDYWKRYAESIESQRDYLQGVVDRLTKEVNNYHVWLQGNISECNVRIAVYERQLGQCSELLSELNKLNETYYYRSFRLKDYRNPLLPSETTLHLWYPGSAYILHRLYRKHIKMVIKYNPSTGQYYVEKEVIDYVKNVVKESIPIFQEIATEILENGAGGDKEFYSNLILQIVHQLKYMETSYSKYPVETLVEGVGDCDCLALLLATFLEAAGIDTVLVIEKLGNGLHVRVGVNLPSPPDDLYKYGRTQAKYIRYNNKMYYLAEPTWDITKADPLDPSILGFFIGDPVQTGKIITVIDV